MHVTVAPAVLALGELALALRDQPLARRDRLAPRGQLLARPAECLLCNPQLAETRVDLGEPLRVGLNGRKRGGRGLIARGRELRVQLLLVLGQLGHLEQERLLAQLELGKPLVCSDGVLVGLAVRVVPLRGEEGWR